MLTTSEDRMYDNDRPESPRLLDALAFYRLIRDEARAVLLETAGVAATHLSAAASIVAERTAEAGRSLRASADEAGARPPVPESWSVVVVDDVPEEDDVLHALAERAAAMSRHPSMWEPGE